MDIDRTRVSAVIVKDKKILLLRGHTGFYKDFYFTPGGKIEEGETDRQALERELKEELDVDLMSEKFLFEYVAKNWEGGMQKARCYLVNIDLDIIKLSGEIGDMMWYSKEDFDNKVIPISPSMEEFLVPKLIEEKYL